jgi:hypothetical protein
VARLDAADGTPLGLAGVWATLLTARKTEVGAAPATSAREAAPATGAAGRSPIPPLAFSPSGKVAPVTEGLVLPDVWRSVGAAPRPDANALALQETSTGPGEAGLDPTAAPTAHLQTAPRSWLRQLVALAGLLAVIYVGMLNRPARRGVGGRTV